MTADCSIEELSRLIAVDIPILERAVANGLLRPRDGRHPPRFSRAEAGLVADYSAIPRLLGRVRRDSRNDYVGRYIGPEDFEQKNRYILPFRGCWLVTDGGRQRGADGRWPSFHYYLAPCVRWAWDFCVIHPDEFDQCRAGMPVAEMLRLRFRRGQEPGKPDCALSEPGAAVPFREILNPDATDSRLHYLYGADVLAPAPGVILDRRGRADAEGFVAGAHSPDDGSFLIRHDGGEFSQIAHVLGETIAVRPGQRVERGEFLCRAGFKHAFLPHLHWAVWDSWHPVFAQALPVRIAACEVYRDGRFVAGHDVWCERGLLVRNGGAPGDAISLNTERPWERH